LSTKYGWFLPLWSLARLTGCGALIYGLSACFAPESRILTLAKLATLIVLFPVSLLICGEIKKSDFAALRGVIRT
jgi:hypothetical protein